MKYILLFSFLIPFLVKAQDYPLLTAEERAYLFHIVKKSPILENNIGRFFDYKGPDIKHLNGEIHFDSIEEIIINQPELLIIRSEEIAKSPVGLIAEAANKMAIWELNKTLLESRKKSDDENEHFQNNYEKFEQFLIGHLPASAFKEKSDSPVLHPKLDNVFNPSLSLDDKKAMLQSFRYLDDEDALQVLKALNYATNAYVEERSKEIYLALGGKADTFKNVLIAAGDGSNTTGLLEEREKDEKGRWNRGLPKAVGLFPYDLALEEKVVSKKKKVISIEPNRAPVRDFLTVGNYRMTNVHFDVWGYNAEKQTTVVIEKNGKTYRLFGSGETRFLSPDPDFAGKGTYQSLIDDLDKVKIVNLEEMIYGKKGFDYWIDYNEKKKVETTLKIEKTEKKYSDLGYAPIKTSKNVTRKVRKQKRKSKVLTDYQPKTKSNKKVKAQGQNEILYLYEKRAAYIAKIKELQEQKEEAFTLLSSYQTRLDGFKTKYGLYPMPYTVEDGLYTFEDSTTFDMNTQEFVFQATADTIPFEVRLLAIPNSSLSEQADEVMLHINMVDAAPRYNARLKLKLNDVFESDQYVLKNNLLSAKDSVAMQLFFEGLLNKKVDFEIIARGNGVGQFVNGTVQKAYPQEEESAYPGNTESEKLQSKMDPKYAQLRLSEVYINLGREIVLEVNSYTDPVFSNVKLSSEQTELMTKNGWSKNEMLSALRTEMILKKLKEEVNVLAGQYLTRTDAKIVIDRFNKDIQKTRISVGKSSMKGNL
jgi:hypothetical protein|tara:strand:+ start:52410 stop:54686 length:2277 start_codon:yes stop_codon:yes gene_type:complete